MKSVSHFLSLKILVIIFTFTIASGTNFSYQNFEDMSHNCLSRHRPNSLDGHPFNESDNLHLDFKMESVIKVDGVPYEPKEIQSGMVQRKFSLPYKKTKRSFKALSATHEGLQVKEARSLSRNQLMSHYLAGHSRSIAGQSLEKLLTFIISLYLDECEFIIITDRNFKEVDVLKTLLGYPMLKQIVFIEQAIDLALQVQWKSSSCQAVFVLLSDDEPFLQFSSAYPHLWAFFGKVIIAGLNEDSIEKFTESKKGKKTQHIIGLVNDDRNDQFRIMMNLLFWGEGLMHITTWKNGAFTREVNLFPDKISNLQKGVVKVGVFEWPPATSFQRDSEGKFLQLYGLDPTVVDTLSEVYNFTLQYVFIPEDEIYGSLLPNGSFNGLVGSLERDELHMGIANIWPSAVDGRHLVQDYSTHYAADEGCFLTRIEPPLPKWQNPILPFQPATWMAFFFSLLLSGPAFYIIIMASSKIGLDEGHFKSFWKANLYTYSVHFSQPMTVAPKNSSMKVFLLFLWLYSLIITTGYTSNLIAFLTISKQPKGIETVKELSESGMNVITIPYCVTILRTSENEYFRALASQTVIKYVLDDEHDILNGKAVAMNSRTGLESFSELVKTSKGKHLLRIMKERFSSSNYATIAFPHYSPLKPTFNKNIAKFYESGIARVWFEKINEYRVKLDKESGKERIYNEDLYDFSQGLVPLTIEHVESIFIILVFGYTFSTIGFATEVMIARK